MKIFGEELGATGRWYIALPPILLVGFLIGLFFVAVASQTRLNAASERVHASLVRQQALVEFSALISDAESAQRGYLLTGETSYLKPYRTAASQTTPALDRVHAAYGGDDDPQFRQLRLLTGRKLGELEDGIALYSKRAHSAAVSIDADAGTHTADQIDALISNMRSVEAARLAAATGVWQGEFHLSRLVMAAGAVLSLALVFLASRLVYQDMRRRAAQTTFLRDQKLELERQVEQRTRDLATLSTHLQGVSEQEKSALSRELHDELGGLLVAARMDLSWLQQRLKIEDPAMEQRFRRIHDSLSAGVDLKRRVVEELRPTLLDNMGLFAALRWQFRETCRRHGMRCTEAIPESEMKIHPDAAIGVFRIAQEALTNILKHAEAHSADVSVVLTDQIFTLRVSDDGKGLPHEVIKDGTGHGLAAMRHRVLALGGTCEVSNRENGGTLVETSIPLSRMLIVTS
ncbi:MAG TPA: CHASE3 domain-containing protein [Steroidobacteraceae bacterium]|jgi:hypothetical protein